MFQRLLAKKLSPDFVDGLVKLELSEILSVCEPSEVYLFGSAARGEMTDASDMDFLVLLKNHENLKDVKAKYYCRKKNHQWPVDIVMMHEADYLIKSQVGGVPMICALEGKLLYKGLV